jgi:hypothetical protein
MDTQPAQPAANGSMLSVLETRRAMYAKAVETAKTSGDGAKARRLDRQLKVIVNTYTRGAKHVRFDRV